MAVPVLLSTSPSDGSTGIPVGESLEFLFDRGIDLETAKSAVVMYGSDFDKTSGPGQALWIDKDTGNNPFFLKSPGFKGTVPLSYKLVYVDLDTLLEVDPGLVTSELDETGFGVAGIGHKLIATPEAPLAADTLYNITILGDPDGVGNGISSRTVFDVEPDGGNSSTTGTMHAFGGYTRAFADRIIVEITTSGDIGTALYKWYYLSAGVGSAITGRVVSSRYRRLADGLQVRFEGSGFVAGDLYDFNVEPIERMATSTQLSFTTNDGSYVAPPESPSVPAPCEPPASVLPPAVGGPTLSGPGALYVTNMLPEDRSFNVNPNTRQIIITFSEDVDPATITDNTVTLYKASALGEFAETFAPQELSKKLTVVGNVLTIDY